MLSKKAAFFAAMENIDPVLAFSQLQRHQTIGEGNIRKAFVQLYERNQELQESLNYAGSLQRGLLPKERHMNRAFTESFVLFSPYQEVSGDFYWVAQKQELKYFAVGDCTGHGAAAAMLTMLAYSFLNHIIMYKNHITVDKILCELDRKLIEIFQSENDSPFDNDWLDISLCCFDPTTRTLHFSGANRKLLLVQGGESYLIDGNPYPVGGWQIEADRTYPARRIAVEKGDCVYLGSDGYQHQFGGDHGKKFSSSRLHKMLVENAHLPMLDQREELAQTLIGWRGSRKQVDDICIMGVRL